MKIPFSASATSASDIPRSATERWHFPLLHLKSQSVKLSALARKSIFCNIFYDAIKGWRDGNNERGKGNHFSFIRRLRTFFPAFPKSFFLIYDSRKRVQTERKFYDFIIKSLIKTPDIIASTISLRVVLKRIRRFKHARFYFIPV